MKYKYYSGSRFLCEANTKVSWGKDFPAVREVVEEDVKPSIKKKEAVVVSDTAKTEEEK